jgi:DNA-binding transcriptional MerR regulator
MNTVKEELDQEWIDLILEALEMGLSITEIKTFFLENTK